MSSRDRKNVTIKPKLEKITNKSKEKKVTENKSAKVVKKKNTNRMEVEKKAKKKHRFFRIILSIFLTLCILGVFAVAAFLIYIVATTEDFDPEALKNQDQTVIYDRDGNEIATLGNEKRESVE